MSICKKCGAEIAEGYKFCPQCGAAVEKNTGNKFCPQCGNKLAAGMIFCSECGARVAEAGTAADAAANAAASAPKPSANYTAPEKIPDTGTALCSVWVSHYNGECKFGPANGTGTFYVYSNRVEFKTMIAGQLAVYRMDQIARAYEIKFELVFPALVVELKDGQKHTYSSPVNGTSVKECISLINKYKR